LLPTQFQDDRATESIEIPTKKGIVCVRVTIDVWVRRHFHSSGHENRDHPGRLPARQYAQDYNWYVLTLFYYIHLPFSFSFTTCHEYILNYTYHSRLVPKGVAVVPQIFLRDTHVLPKLAMSNSADVTGGKPVAVLQSISGVSAINPIVAFYDIHGGKRELFTYFVPDTTRDKKIIFRI
jgi:hypothetical protein